MEHLFEQQSKESAKAFEAFSVYLSLGAERSLSAVGQKLGKSVGLVERWSAKFDWPVRVAAHAAHLAVVERGAIEAAARSKAAEWESREHALRETEWAMHEAAIAAAKRGLTAYMEREKSLCEPCGHCADAGDREQAGSVGNRPRHGWRAAQGRRSANVALGGECGT